MCSDHSDLEINGISDVNQAQDDDIDNVESVRKDADEDECPLEADTNESSPAMETSGQSLSVEPQNESHQSVTDL